jgi:hypothetical protein
MPLSYENHPKIKRGCPFETASFLFCSVAKLRLGKSSKIKMKVSAANGDVSICSPPPRDQRAQRANPVLGRTNSRIIFVGRAQAAK